MGRSTSFYEIYLRSMHHLQIPPTIQATFSSQPSSTSSSVSLFGESPCKTRENIHRLYYSSYATIFSCGEPLHHSKSIIYHLW
mmetsp:Transcript_1567/g.2809  ORF Transcript_1567/g.2809 Transcript_1567/m.2809 type:complete len:83 (+) Transcript_1567:942-1190(+)